MLGRVRENRLGARMEGGCGGVGRRRGLKLKKEQFLRVEVSDVRTEVQWPTEKKSEEEER